MTLTAKDYLLWVAVPYAALGMCIVGLIILIYRRRTVGPVFSATTRNDKVMYVLLGLTLALGLGATMYGYLTRPYIVYRSRDVQTPGESKPKRGWEPVGH
ncbi:respiratory nitrate reductase subunit gamma [Nocardia sp. NPDC004151]|uniref:respiratory nitrate reductase subunit gamma n=1 Tax=Nocardia sp. NPDC004151 TaxID=3364304 RepID=UPI00368DC199